MGDGTAGETFTGEAVRREDSRKKKPSSWTLLSQHLLRR
jgi:hypothetical protein